MGSGDLYDCLRGADCILTPDVHEIVRHYAGCNLTTASSGLPGKLRLYLCFGIRLLYNSVKCFITSMQLA